MKFKEYISESEEKNLIGLTINDQLITPETPREIWPVMFDCGDKKLTSLKGSPKEVKSFWCNKNKLTSLEGGPSIVNGGFNCSNNLLTSLKYAPWKVAGDFLCHLNQLSSLEGCPKTVEGNFSCGENDLTSLDGCPSVVKGDFRCYGNEMTSLKDIHKKIHRISGVFNCKSSPIESHVLGLLLIPGITTIVTHDEWGEILNKHLSFRKGKAGLLDAQAELIEAGLEEYAQL